MNKTKIEWCDYTWNPVVGCERGCSYCYAKRIFQRFNKIDKFEDLTFYPERLKDSFPKRPSKIFVGSMSDICYWRLEWMNQVLEVIKKHPEHTFMFLTKDGSIYGDYVFPENCWLGITYTKHWKFSCMHENKKNKRFISIEPLLEELDGLDIGALWDLVIIGGLTPKPAHKKEWVDKIIKHCQDCGINYFLKSNLGYKGSSRANG